MLDDNDCRVQEFLKNLESKKRPNTVQCSAQLNP